MDEPQIDISLKQLSRTARMVATVFGIGFAPIAPGTVASLVALPLAWAIAHASNRFVLLLAGIFVGAIGAWACELYVRAKKDKDPSECVIDEVAGQWIACAFISGSYGMFSAHTLLGYALAFVLFRALDISKLWPINWIERITPGGLGVMLDDILAGAMAGIVIFVLALFGLP
ncbi:MAG: phosphatidylglycerophosphatase A [Rhizomicrobium sp.]